MEMEAAAGARGKKRRVGNEANDRDGDMLLEIWSSDNRENQRWEFFWKYFYYFLF
jgi:hypothetical protein